MAKFKVQNNVWSILKDGGVLYFKNIGVLTRYMLFPVLGQIVGIILIFGLTAWFNFNLPVWLEEHTFLNNFSIITILLVLITIPGFAIFLKAFWDFLVAYGALNSMTEAVITTGKLYDLRAHTEVVTKRSFSYICLLIVISVLSFIAVNPLFWIIGLIFFIYFILVFQVFTFENNLSTADYFKKSFSLVKGDFGRTFLIMIILGGICYYLLSYGVSRLFDFIKLSTFFKGVLENWVQTLPLAEVNAMLTSFRIPEITALDIANRILNSAVLFLAAGLTLPLRSICWTLWYKNLAEIKTEKKKGK